MRFNLKTGRRLFFLLLVLTTQSVFSQNGFKFNSQYIESAFYKNNHLGSEACHSFSSVAYGNSFSFYGSWNSITAFRLGDETKELTAAFDFWPEIFNLKDSGFSFGHKFTYHFLDYGRWCYENDLLLEPFMKYTGRQDWFFLLSMGFALKEQKIKTLGKWLKQDYISVYIELNKKFTKNLEAYLLASDHDDFRYYLFPSPLYTMGGAWTFNDKVRVYLNFQLHCCDMLTTKFYINGEQLSGGFRVYL